MFGFVSRSQSAIDQIGSIEYNALRTVIVLKIGDENDNRPEFSTITSPLTIGYPNAEITRQLLPPFLTQVQVRTVLSSEKERSESRLPYTLHRISLSEDISKSSGKSCINAEIGAVEHEH